MSGALAVFVKTPGLSPVKTRLAAILGQESAEAFHLAASRSVAAVADALSQQVNLQSYYAVAEGDGLEYSYWQDLPCVWQGEGGLGERMAHIYQLLLTKHDFVILVGADIPQMTTTELLDATTWLADAESDRLAFGPSVDGGFWMFGGNCPVPQKLWTDVIYSTPETGAHFLKEIEQLGTVKAFAVLRDVDEVSDLLPLRDALLNLPEPLPEQYELLRFLDVLPASFS